MTLCNITGVVQKPDGTPLADAVLEFLRLGPGVSGFGSIAIVARPILVTLNGAGEIDADFLHGSYAVQTTGPLAQPKELIGKLVVPNEATAIFGQILAQPGPLENGLIAQAIAAANAASASADAAALSESNAAASEAAAGVSEVNAAASEVAAGLSEVAAAASEAAAGVSEVNAAASEAAAGVSEANAAASEAAAGVSEANAAASESAAGVSEANAAASEAAAAASAASISLPLAVTSGGTGATDAATARANLGVPLDNIAITGGTINGTVIGGSTPAAISGTTGSFSGDVSIADKIVHTGDTNTAIRFPANDTVTVETNGAERLRITSTGSVGIGTSSPVAALSVQGDILAPSPTAGLSSFTIGVQNAPTNAFSNQKRGSLVIQASSAVGTANSMGGGDLTLRAGDSYSASDNIHGDVRIIAGRNLLGSSVGAGNITFTSNNTERARIDASGNLLVGKTASNAGATAGTEVFPGGLIYGTRSGNPVAVFNRLTSNGGILLFRQSGTTVGSISVTGSSTSYNTSSDYRLKENVVPLANAADRLAQIPVHRFNFLADPDTTVDGFLAHEVQAFVPEAVTGEKDGEEMQAIDHSKLVPLLTAALQEALQKIEALEARITALEA